jgi:hypothetical protein
MFDDLIQTGLPGYFEDDAVDTRWTYESLVVTLTLVD